jgi:hypothetical protein
MIKFRLLILDCSLEGDDGLSLGNIYLEDGGVIVALDRTPEAELGAVMQMTIETTQFARKNTHPRPPSPFQTTMPYHTQQGMCIPPYPRCNPLHVEALPMHVRLQALPRAAAHAARTPRRRTHPHRDNNRDLLDGMPVEKVGVMVLACRFIAVCQWEQGRRESATCSSWTW